MKLEGRLTGSPHTIKLESFAHLFLLIKIRLATAYLIWQRGHRVDAALDLVAQNFLLFKLADHEVFDGHFLFSLFNLPELLRVRRQGLVIGTHCLLLLERRFDLHLTLSIALIPSCSHFLQGGFNCLALSVY